MYKIKYVGAKDWKKVANGYKYKSPIAEKETDDS